MIPSLTIGHPNAIRYDGTNLEQIRARLTAARDQKDT